MEDPISVESSDQTLTEEERQAQSENAVFLKLATERLVDHVESFGDNKTKMIDDLEFLEGDGNQWPENIKAERDADQRPTLEINKLPRYLDQLVGDERQNRPQIKIRPADSVATKDTASTMNGLMRNIQVTSDANVAYDHAYEHSGAAGLGFIRVATQYADSKSFNQLIKILKVDNALAVAWDPDAMEYDLSDARWMMILVKVRRGVFKAKYPESAMVDFTTEDNQAWCGKDHVIVAEYFVKTPKRHNLYLVNRDGKETTTTELADGEEAIKTRVVSENNVIWYKITSKDVLEKKTWPGKYIPLVPVWGKELNVNGRKVFRGIVRHAKDPMRLYNYSRSHGAEATSLAPKSPYLMTPEQLEGHKSQWDQAHRKNYPFLLYNFDANAPGLPTRQTPAQVSTGIIAEIQLADQELPDTVGLPEASLGDKTNEKSGKAILARQAKGSLGNYAYADNLARSLVQIGRICVDLMPVIYDTDDREERVQEEDGTEKTVTLNTKDEDGTPLNDVRVGAYDVISTVGPSYATQQEEAAEGMLGFLKVYPDAAPVIGDLVAKTQNWPGAEEIAKRLRKMIPPGIAEPEEGEEGTDPAQGVTAPGGAGPPLPAGPGPEEMAMTETMLEISVEKEEVLLDQEKQDLRKKKAEADLAEEKLKQARAGGGGAEG